jgi:exonuclease SbcD
MPYLMKGFMLAREEFLGKTVEEARQAMETRYAEYIADLAGRCDSALPTIFMGHFWVRGTRLSAWQQGYFNVNEPQVEVSDLARPEFDYVALGHIHRHQDLNRTQQPPVVYSGSPDTIDFGERGERKGVVLVNLLRGSATYEFVETPETRPFIEMEVDVPEEDEFPTETILAEIGRHRLGGSVARLTYHVSAEQVRAIRDKDIREALAPAFLVVAIRRDVKRDQQSRSKALSESLDPAAALGHYLDLDEKKKKRKAELMQYAELLFEELRKEEALK